MGGPFTSLPHTSILYASKIRCTRPIIPIAVIVLLEQQPTCNKRKGDQRGQELEQYIK